MTLPPEEVEFMLFPSEEDGEFMKTMSCQSTQLSPIKWGRSPSWQILCFSVILSYSFPYTSARVCPSVIVVSVLVASSNSLDFLFSNSTFLFFNTGIGFFSLEDPEKWNVLFIRCIMEKIILKILINFLIFLIIKCQWLIHNLFFITDTTSKRRMVERRNV